MHDVALLDLDGVVYVGKQAVPGAPAALAAARGRGIRLAFVTNNAARPPHAVAEHLVELGIEATSDEVITSAQAAARYLADRLPPGSRVLVLGTTGLYEALAEHGLQPASEADSSIAAVVQGYSPEMNWRLLAEGAVAINRGVLWVATNVDPTVPSPRGPLPGNGSLVAALRHATNAEPVVTGKPDPTMHRETVLRTGAERPLVVGDRLDTDIEGATAVGCPSLLVLSGVTTATDLLNAPADLRPTYLAADVGGLLTRHPTPRIRRDGTSCGSWTVAVTSRGLTLQHDVPPADDHDVPPVDDSGACEPRDDRAGAGPIDDLDALRALCAARWERGADDPPVLVVARAGDDGAAATLARLGLD